MVWKSGVPQYRAVAPFHPSDPNELLAELTGGLPADVEVRTFIHHDKTNEMRGLVIAKGNFGKEATKYAIHRNRKLMLLQVENAPFFLCLWPKR